MSFYGAYWRVQGCCGFVMFGKEKKASEDQYAMLMEFLPVKNFEWQFNIFFLKRDFALDTYITG